MDHIPWTMDEPSRKGRFLFGGANIMSRHKVRYLKGNIRCYIGRVSVH